MTQHDLALQGMRELVSASGSNAKKEILNAYKDNKDFKDFLYYALNPMLTYKISEKTLSNYSDVKDETRFRSIFVLCEYLASKAALSNNEIEIACAYLNAVNEPLYNQLITKTLRLGVTAVTVNKVITNLIPVWEVQQAYKIDDYPIQQNTEFWLTQKMNGVRATFYKGKLYARNGSPYNGLEHITKQLSTFCDKYVFDGELVLTNDAKGMLSDNEAFRKSTGIINSDAADKTCIKYVLFDCIRLDDFDGFDSNHDTYSQRRQMLDKFNMMGLNDHIEVLPLLYHGTDASKIDTLLDKMVSEDKEGLMVNLDVPYKRTRHRGILKVKRFYTMDLRVIAVEDGTGRNKNRLGNVIVDFDGSPVCVGSGFSDEQRDYYWNNKSEIIGKLIEVKYKEISTNKLNNQKSLQFPVFVRLRTDKNCVSYS